LTGGHIFSEVNFSEISGPDSFSDDSELGSDRSWPTK
jgi:hypothetical protein